MVPIASCHWQKAGYTLDRLSVHCRVTRWTGLSHLLSLIHFSFWGGDWESGKILLFLNNADKIDLLVDRICTDTWGIWANLGILPFRFSAPHSLSLIQKHRSVFFFVNLIFLIQKTDLFVLFYSWIQYACSCKSENNSCSSSAKLLQLS